MRYSLVVSGISSPSRVSLCETRSSVASPIWWTRFVVGAAPPQQRLHAGDELADAERLGDVVVGAELEAADDLLLLALGGEHDDRQLELPLADLPADFVAVELRQHDVEQQQVGRFAERRGESGVAVRGRADVVALRAKIVGQPAEQGGVVFDDEDGCAVSLGRRHRMYGGSCRFASAGSET